MTFSQPHAARASDPIEELYRAHALTLTRFALLLVGDKATAEDVDPAGEQGHGLVDRFPRADAGRRGTLGRGRGDREPGQVRGGATFLRTPLAMYCTSSQNYTQLYTLTLTAAGGLASLSPLYRIPIQFDTSVPSGGSALAVSADGRSIAYATAPCGHRTSTTQQS